MKTTKEIEADFGLNETESRLLVCVVTGLPIPGDIHHAEMQTMIKALYRRIEAMENSEMWVNEFAKFRRAVRQALFECGVMSNPGSADEELATAIVQLGKDKKSLLENCVIMQSRVAAILRVEEAVDTLCDDNIFGEHYEELLKADNRELRAVILQAGGQLDEFTEEGDNR